VGAVVVLQLDPERAKQIREMEANFGKTWLMGKVTAINETKSAFLPRWTTPRTSLWPTRTRPSASAATPSPLPIFRW